MPSPFPELQKYDPSVPREQPQREGWFADLAREERARQLREGVIQAPPPDTVARTTSLARQTGEAPLYIEGREDEYERALQASNIVELSDQYPVIDRFFFNNPRIAAAAVDDTESLGFFGSAWDTLKKLPETGAASFYGIGSQGAKINYGIADTLGALGDTLSSFATPGQMTRGELQDRKTARDAYWRGGVENAEQSVAEARPEYTGYVQRNILQGIENIPQSGIAILAGIATKNPNVAAGLMATQTGAVGYGEARLQGVDRLSALNYGVQTGAAEGLTELMPASFLVSAIAKRTPFGKTLIQQLGTEIPGEQVATALQDFSEWVILNPEATLGDYISARPEAALSTLLQTTSATTAQTSLIVATDRTVRAAQNLSNRASQAAGARWLNQSLDRMVKGVEQSKLGQRDPEALRELLREQARETGAENVFIPGESIKDFFQSDRFDPDANPFSEINWQEADAIGGDVVMPIEDYLTDVVGSPAFDAVKDNVRLSPGGMSKLEADAFENAMDEVMGEISEEFAKRDKAEIADRTVRDQLVADVALMFGESFTSPVARQIAEVAVSRAQTRADRLGQPLTGSEFDNFSVKQVMPEGVAEAVKADTLDLVINSMREGGDANIGEGGTLLDFIKERGGINDSGGDLAAMGLPKSMIREFDADQGALSGISGAGNYGADTILRDAIDDGFFPELANVQNEAGVSELDASVLLDAIAKELSGQTVHRTTRNDRIREAAAELRELLSSAGLDPDGMSDADVRAAVERMETEGGLGEGLDQLPETIDIDGVTRPTTNSEGQPLAQTEEGVRKFWEWFGESKVVDADGKPLVVYHGTLDDIQTFDRSKLGENTKAKSAIAGFFFTSDPSVAASYAHYAATVAPVERLIEQANDAEKLSDWDGYDAKIVEAESREKELQNFDNRLQGQNVMPVYLQSTNPVELDAKGESFYGIEDDIHAAIKEARRDGDGAIFRDLDDAAGLADRDADHFLVFNPEQIKSVNNRGTFDPADARILYQANYAAQRWARIVEAIVRGDPAPAIVELGTTPAVLVAMGMPSSRLIMARGKIARARREHPEVPLDVWRKLPALLSNPRAVFPSPKDDGSFIVSIEANDANGAPVIVPIIAAQENDTVVLSVYGKDNGRAYIASGIKNARADGKQVYLRRGLADDLVSSEELPSKAASQAPIASEVPAKPSRKVLSLGDVVNKKRTLEQSAQGRIIFDENKRIIELFQGRNLSTPLHELGHMWLEELSFDASLSDAPQQIKDDFETVKGWFAKSGHPIGKDGQIPVAAHELWARGTERYFMEGKSPTQALNRLFETFRSWMVGIYKTVKQLKAPITPQIREVMDRMIATDQEIETARDKQMLEASEVFQQIAQMSGEELAVYQKQVKDANAQAHSSLLEKTMSVIRRREEKRYAGIRKEIKAEEAERLENEPPFRAMRLMLDEPISRDWIKEEFGEDAPNLMPKGKRWLHSKTGVDPTVIAELSGYRSASEMVTALMGIEKNHREAKKAGDKRSLKARLVDVATDKEFDHRYGDPLTDGTIEREALAVVHSEQQGELIATELRILARQVGQRPTPYRIARDWARGKVRSGIVMHEAMPAAIQRYTRNAARSGKAAQEAMVKGDAETAFKNKQFQMMNNALVAESKEAHDTVNAAVKRMDKVARAKTRKSVDQDYLEQAHALLEGVDLRKRSQVGLDRQGQWEAWAAQRGAEGHDVLTPGSFEATIGKTNWTRLSVENLLVLDEQIKQILHLGRLKQTLLDNNERRDRAELVAEASRNADDIGRKPPKGSFTDPSWWDDISSGVLSLDAALLKMEQVFDWLDRGDSNGVFNRVVFRPIAAAQDNARKMLEDYYTRLKEARDKVAPETLRRWAERVTIDLIDPETGTPAVFERKKLVAMALNWGNAGNRQRLADGYGWSQEGIERVLMQELNESEWNFVQDTWNILDGLWPEIEKMERAINGVAPERIEAIEIETPFGKLKGGYYPAVYDTSLDYSSEEQAGRKADLFSADYIRATTRSSATKARIAKVSRPLLLDIGVITRHVGEVVHDVTHREAVMQAHSFLTDRTVMRAVDDTLGREIRKQFTPWINHVANSWASERAGHEGWGKWLGKLRANVTMVGMGWRFTTMLTQIAGYTHSFEMVGERWVAPEIAKFAAQMSGSVGKVATFQGVEMPPMMAFAMERSKELPSRMNTLDRDIRRELDRMAAQSAAGQAFDKLSAAKQFAYHGIGYMDRLVSIPTWTGAYNKAISQGMSEEDAAYAGDKAVRLSQGAGAAKDLAAVSTGQGRYGKLLTFLTMFYSFVSTNYARQRNLGRDVARGDATLPRLMARAWWMLLVAPILPELLSGRGPDEDEDAGWWIFKLVTAQSLSAIPVVRDVWSPAWDGIAGNRGFDYRMSPAQGAGQSVVRVAKDIGRIADGKETKRATRNAMELVGYSTGLVPGQAASTTQFLVDVGSGDADPEGFAEWYEGLTKGRIKE